MREELKQREQNQIDGLTGIPTVRLAIGFCALGLLGALFLIPIADNAVQKIAGMNTHDLPGNVDRTVTGTISPQNRTERPRRYTIRRSVMQQNPTAPCFLYEDGTQEGDC